MKISSILVAPRYCLYAANAICHMLMMFYFYYVVYLKHSYWFDLGYVFPDYRPGIICWESCWFDLGGYVCPDCRPVVYVWTYTGSTWVMCFLTVER